ncbi:MAG: hypothetical protein ACJAX5_003117, partial [Patiriisocius sp.]
MDMSFDANDELFRSEVRTFFTDDYPHDLVIK